MKYVDLEKRYFQPFKSNDDEDVRYVVEALDFTPRTSNIGFKIMVKFALNNLFVGKSLPIIPCPFYHGRKMARNQLIGHRYGGKEFSILSYNIFTTTKTNWYVDWNYRKGLILLEIQHLNADIVCLQEVMREAYNEFRTALEPEYDSLFMRKSYINGANASDKEDSDQDALNQDALNPKDLHGVAIYCKKTISEGVCFYDCNQR
ncbi:hypothetical protein H6P81_000176 [Aristolochia fimbriata]|uniref:Endonuclease/exonuclease/phosphatase domain-containing protein n=1 Tax=Aristolochia fimbriata TaxID=158543 RepID=A0AAV7F3T2_ARIFI|nr:hypothetical protein H6P81_000176 [Aristolochia fimbriata]